MAIEWGAWEDSGGNGMRVGIDVSWRDANDNGSIQNNTTAAEAVVKIYTENRYHYNDSQTLSYSGSISGSTTFTNDDGTSSSGGGAKLRATKYYTYTYSSSSYGSSPGNRTFTASLSGAYNGVTPSKSVTDAIPARPYAAPAAPSNVGVSRVSDTQTTITWTRNATSGKPYDNMYLQRSTNGGAWATVSSSISGTATSYTNGTAANSKYKYQIRAENSAGNSAFVASPDIYTTPAVPGAPTRTEISGPIQQITWSNSGMGYSEYQTEIIGYKNDVSVGVIGTVASGVATFDHTTSNAVSPYTTSDRWKYTVRHRTASGTLLRSAETAFTSETAGVTSPPNAPTNLHPAGVVKDPTKANDLTWQHNSTDSSGQQKFIVRHRVNGTSTWTTIAEVTSTSSAWTMPANTYTSGQDVEWQVQTKGSDATYSAFSSSAVFTMAITKKIVPQVDLGTGRIEADLTAHDWKYPTLLNGWVNYGGAYTVARYCKRGGVVYVQGLVKDGTANSVVFNLPTDYRPSGTLPFTTPTSIIDTANASTGTAHTHPISNGPSRVDVLANGNVLVNKGDSTWISINLCFPVD